MSVGHGRSSTRLGWPEASPRHEGNGTIIHQSHRRALTGCLRPLLPVGWLPVGQRRLATGKTAHLEGTYHDVRVILVERERLESDSKHFLLRPGHGKREDELSKGKVEVGSGG